MTNLIVHSLRIVHRAVSNGLPNAEVRLSQTIPSTNRLVKLLDYMEIMGYLFAIGEVTEPALEPQRSDGCFLRSPHGCHP